MNKPRQYVFHHGKPCPYCGAVMMLGTRTRPTCDHVKSRLNGGRRSNKNKLFVCSRCNSDKGHHGLVVWAAMLERDNDPRAARVKQLVEDRRAAGLPA